MKRVDFIKKASFAVLGSVLSPNLLLQACKKNELVPDVKFEGKVLIVGAGAAGLYAAYILKERGIAFEIVEASAVHGGRLAKLTGFATYPLDLGAQWLHGRNSIVGDLIDRTKTPITLDNSDQVYWFNSQLVQNLPKNIDIFEGDSLPDISYKDYAIQKGFGPAYSNIVENIAGDQGAAAARLSVYYNNLEEENWSSGDDDFKFQNTYFDLIDQHIASKVKDHIRYNTPVKSIDYSGNNITITDQNNNAYTADKVILTVPITVLKDKDILFKPALPESKTSAFSKIGMDAGMKVFLKFSSPFYDQNIIGGAICAAYADERVGKQGNDAVLLAFIMGTQAEFLTQLGSDNAIINALLQELDAMYNGQATARFIAGHVQNWATNPFIKGAYSYSTVGMGNARAEAAAAVAQKIYFAGEAMNTNGHHQTVHGAVETGYQAVIALLNDLKP